jgi:alkanesulfonate monooxygenase SsuD/methylene tetrahydromethanopterin reductase-like flavin-dependent oxidoreductase (luciferase family)
MPDNMQWLAYLAGKTSRIKLGTGAIILPWHLNPTRVAEKISMLQAILGDRFMLGFGRGLAREEYKAFGVEMGTSRERFDQAAEIVLDILETGVAEYDTPYFKQTRTPVTPKPTHGYRDRGFLSVAMTPDSAMAAPRGGRGLAAALPRSASRQATRRTGVLGLHFLSRGCSHRRADRASIPHQVLPQRHQSL